MKPIVTPVYRPTADCIWNSFRSSGKQHLILTGNRGSGKSTLLSQLFPRPLPGLTTWAKPGKAVFLKENLSAHVIQVGVYDETLHGAENKMVIQGDGFLSLGIPALKRCMECDSDWVSIDEVGYLEALCEPYHSALRELMEKKHVAAVVRKQELPFLRELYSRDDVFLVDLDRPFGNVGCVIMASGIGKRFGSNKLMANFHGEPLICRILDATEGLFLQRVVVTRHEAVASLCSLRSIPVVLHNRPHRSDTVRLGLEYIGNVDSCMFCPADQPLLRKETIASLLLAAVNSPQSIWRTAFDGNPGSPVLFPRWAFPELLCLPDGKGGGIVIKKYPERLHTVSVRDKYELMDVDTTDDLASLVER